jgi:hypothetical protein
VQAIRPAVRSALAHVAVTPICIYVNEKTLAMTTADLFMHRSAMADMRIAHITVPAERRMKAKTAEEQLRFALADSHSYEPTLGQYVGSSQRNLELCKYLIGV